MKSGYYEKLDATSLAVLDNCPYYNMGTIITRINVPARHRSKGVASKLLRAIITDADKEREDLWLEISPSDGLDYEALAAWYRRYGFVDRGGIFHRAAK